MIARDSGAAPDDPSSAGLPAHYALGSAQVLFSGISLASAFLLLAALAFRMASRIDLWQWWVPLALAGGMTAADLGSGLVHWGADTWGRDDLPVIGRRLLIPFRVHHINPTDFLHRRFVDTNGDAAFLTVPVLLGLLLAPLETAWGTGVAVFGFALCGVGMMTNQIHQWAHMPSPPRPIRLLQSGGLILRRAEHAAHHERPYDGCYCITTGWCNRPLEAIGFFRHLERAISSRSSGSLRDVPSSLCSAASGWWISPISSSTHCSSRS